MKKSQVSAFIFVSILLLVLFGIIIIVSSIEAEQDLSGAFTPTLFPVERYVTQCIEHELQPLVKQVALQGGSLDVNRESTFAGKNTRFILHYSPHFGNYLIHPQKVADELITPLTQRLQECIDLREYEKRGYTVTAGNLSVELRIAPNMVITDLTYPLVLERGEEIIIRDEFKHSLQSELGRRLNDARDILNSELQGNLHTDHYRLANLDVSFTKDTPYPYVTYTITDEKLTFNFGLEDYDHTLLKFSRPDLLLEREHQGTCYIDNQCYSYAREQTCLDEGGEYRADDECRTTNRPITESMITGEGASCDAWFDVYSGEVMNQRLQSGESVCSYEPGVGGRFYKLSCINGQMFADPCKDFREEICVEETNEYTLASCRVNRFWSCADCTTQACCENERRDCAWSGTQCFPVASPGIKFWNVEEATSICSANEIQCRSGDCRARMNYFGDYAPDTELLNLQHAAKNNLIRLPEMTGIELIQQLPESISLGFVELLNMYLSRLDQLMTYDIEQYLAGAIQEQADTTFCPAWNPPSSNRCDACNVDYALDDATENYAPCTEYKCKSLGAHCQFEIRNGTPLCFAPDIASTPVTLTTLAVEGYTASEEQTVLGTGIVLEESVVVHRPLRITIETDAETRCKLSYLPRRFKDVPITDLSGFEYRANHTAGVLFTHTNEVLQSIPGYFGAAGYTDLVEDIIMLSYSLENARYDTLQLHRLVAPLAEYYQESGDQLHALFSYLDEEEYLIFVSCRDRSGNENPSSYIRFRLAEQCDIPPEILRTIPSEDQTTDGRVEVFLNKIGACRYDVDDRAYDSMRHDFTCDTNPYQATRYGYRCVTELEELHEKIVVRCRDNIPGKTIQFVLNEELEHTDTIDISNVSGEQAFNAEELEIIFDRPMTCEGFRCSSTRCVSDEPPESFVCRTAGQQCPIQQEVLTEIQINPREVLTILEAEYADGTITVITNTDAECGVQLSANQGMLRMQQSGTTFTYAVATDRIGNREARIVCYDTYNDIAQETLQFAIR